MYKNGKSLSTTAGGGASNMGWEPSGWQNKTAGKGGETCQAAYGALKLISLIANSKSKYCTYRFSKNC